MHTQPPRGQWEAVTMRPKCPECRSELRHLPTNYGDWRCDKCRRDYQTAKLRPALKHDGRAEVLPSC
jgi:tRNA(Ile2) C34 agmatinyltransferase TiaS